MPILVFIFSTFFPFFWLEVSLFVCLFFMFVCFFWPRCVACRILLPLPGIEPGPRQWKHQVLTTGPPGNSLARVFKASPKYVIIPHLSPYHSVDFFSWKFISLNILRISYYTRRTSTCWWGKKRLSLKTIKIIHASTTQI